MMIWTMPSRQLNEMVLLSKVPHLLKFPIIQLVQILNSIFFAGNIETKSEATDTISRNVALRNELDLYVNVVECRSYPEVPARHKDVNIAIVRQNTEGEYAMLEHEVNNDEFIYKTPKNYVIFENFLHFSECSRRS